MTFIPVSVLLPSTRYAQVRKHHNIYNEHIKKQASITSRLNFGIVIKDKCTAIFKLWTNYSMKFSLKGLGLLNDFLLFPIFALCQKRFVSQLYPNHGLISLTWTEWNSGMDNLLHFVCMRCSYSTISYASRWLSSGIDGQLHGTLRSVRSQLASIYSSPMLPCLISQGQTKLLKWLRDWAVIKSNLSLGSYRDHLEWRGFRNIEVSALLEAKGHCLWDSTRKLKQINLARFPDQRSRQHIHQRYCHVRHNGMLFSIL